jgi:hypothetical protein
MFRASGVPNTDVGAQTVIPAPNHENVASSHLPSGILKLVEDRQKERNILISAAPALLTLPSTWNTKNPPQGVKVGIFIFFIVNVVLTSISLPFVLTDSAR